MRVSVALVADRWRQFKLLMVGMPDRFGLQQAAEAMRAAMQLSPVKVNFVRRRLAALHYRIIKIPLPVRSGEPSVCSVV